MPTPTRSVRHGFRSRLIVGSGKYALVRAEPRLRASRAAPRW